MTQAIAIHTTPSETEFQIMLQQSEMLVKTGFLPQAIKTKEQALAIILTGRELGIPSMAALNTINVIQGKPTVSPQLMLALIERSGQLENIQIENKNDSVSCTMKRKNRSPHTETFGKTEASALNLIGKDNYKKQPLTMYRWRAVASCARVVFPDVILGLYTPDEMGADVTTDGELIKETPDNVTPFPQIVSGEAVTDPHENWTTEEQYNFAVLYEAVAEMCEFIGYSDKTKKQISEKLSKFQTYAECVEAAEKVNTAYYEKMTEKIKNGLASQNWDAEEIESYLGQFRVTAIDTAEREQLDTIYRDLVDGKMV